MILALNCIGNPRAGEEFDRVTVPRLAGIAGRPVEVAHLVGGGPLPGPERYSHLVLSGSELSAAKGSEWDAAAIAAIRSFADAGRAVLGICWGHQMIARAFAGRDACRRAGRPEFGWRRVLVRENPLFKGVTDPVFAHSHYDEVAIVPEGFDVIADTPDCAVQALQLAGRPLWGVQFHPEVTREGGEEMIRRNLRDDPAIAPYLHRDPVDTGAADRLLANFFLETP